MNFDLGEPTHTHRCTKQLTNGHRCDRQFGCYYNPIYLRDAMRAHDAAQHATTLDPMRDDEAPGEARIRSASRTGKPARVWKF